MNILMEAQADAVNEAAKTVASQNSEASLGYKVFISEVRKQFDWMTDGDFKATLLKLNQMRLITLSRADMAYALDQTMVEASEINHMNSQFHFIRID